jgi:2-iminobutanoate/2-iminopropanoate deaminase
MKLTIVNADSAPQPAGGYSQAVEIAGFERLLFISGQIPEIVAGGVPTDFPSQARLVWRNVVADVGPVHTTVASPRHCIGASAPL